ncbi:unnamed protein product [Rhizophagus irregularis]|nr:unnamed protein product [Rhizophagus irregularis]
MDINAKKNLRILLETTTLYVYFFSKSMCEYMSGSRRARRSRILMDFVLIFGRDLKIHLTESEVEQVLGQRSSSQRSRRSRSNRRSCTRSEFPSRNPFQAPSMPRNEDGDTGNCWSEHSDFIYPIIIL